MNFLFCIIKSNSSGETPPHLTHPKATTENYSLIQKQDTIMRKKILSYVTERLTITLKLLAIGRIYYQCIKCSTIISSRILEKIIPKTCDTI